MLFLILLFLIATIDTKTESRKSVRFLLFYFRNNNTTNAIKIKRMKIISSIFALVFIIAALAAMMASASSSNPFHSLSKKNNKDRLNQQPTALDRYVSYQDPVFSWRRVPDTLSNNSKYSIATFQMISQQWLTPENSDRSIWKHNVVMIIPTNLDPKSENAFIYFTGSNLNKNGSLPDWSPKEFMNDVDLLVAADAATAGECLAFIVDDLPNQPICWPQTDGSQFCGTEDKALGYSFEQFFLQNKSIEHTLMFPMVKAGIAAMNASEQIAEKYLGINLKQLEISGSSKRGWICWLVGATDPLRYKRIKAIIPVVLDAINFADFLKREVQAYNISISWVAAPYRVLAAFVNTSKFEEWASNIDPWYYRDRLTMPKFVITGTEDEFQQLDNQLHILHGLPGEVHNLMARDCDHPLLPNIGLPLDSIKGYAQSIAKNTPRPQYNWSVDETTGQLSVTTNVPPKEVKVYFATTPASSQGRRDFRGTILKNEPCIHLLGGCVRFIPWTSTDFIRHSSTWFSTNVSTPAEGLYTGFLIEMKFANGSPDQGLSDFIFSTPASIVPYNVYPTNGFCESQEACLNLPLV